MRSRPLARIRAFLERRRHQEDLDAELQDHLEQEVARNLERGLDPVEARRVAHVAVGNLTVHAEDGRVAVRGIWVEQLAQDARYAGRVLRRNPAFALAAVLSLGFGIGATSTVFSTINALEFRPLPFHEPGRLVFLAEVAPPTDDFCGGCSSEASAATAIDWLAQVRSYKAAGVMTATSARWVHDDAIEHLDVNRATPEFFRLLGVAPKLGRDFMPGDTLPGAQPVMIVSHGFWQQRLAGDSTAIGRPLPASFDAGTDETIRGAVVVGVLQENFRFNVIRDRQVWLPLRLTPSSSRTARSMTVVARLRDGVGIPSAGAELRDVSARLAAAYPGAYKAWGARVEPLRERLGWGAGANSRLLFGTTALVLLIAVINVAALMAGRALARRQEFAMRRAFGAGRRRLLRQLLVEGTSVGLGGGLVGALVTSWGIRFSSAWFSLDTGVAIMDMRVLVFAFGLSIAVGIITALGPALRISRVDPIGDLRGRGSAAGERGRGFASSALITVQIALGLVLLTAAATLSVDFVRLRYADLGFDPSNLHATTISITPSAARNFSLWRVVAEDARARVATVPGVRSATLEYRSAVHPEIVRPAEGGSSESMTPALSAVETNYFETWRMPILRGRPFGVTDGPSAALVAIVNRSAAVRFWPGKDPVGQMIFVGDSGAPGNLLTVIGMTDDAERGELIERHWPKVYRPLAQATIWHGAGSLQVRIDDRADRAVVLALAQSRVREAIQRPITPFRSVEGELDAKMQRRRLNAIALGVFAVFGLALAAMGVYASIGAAVTRRTREIGVRVALGAAPGGTLRLIVRHGVVLALAGVALGLLGASAMSRILRSVVADTNVLDPRLYTAVAVVMILTASVAAWLPARRVLRLDPVEALRAD